MKEKKVYNVEQEANEEKIDFQEILFKYLIHWPWFVGTVVVFLQHQTARCQQRQSDNSR